MQANPLTDTPSNNHEPLKRNDYFGDIIRRDLVSAVIS